MLATIGRVQEVERFLRSLRGQTRLNFEVIVVDQNPDDRLVDLLSRYAEDFPLKHLRSEPGLSRARNVGLQEARGEIVSFPDDDCWYPPDLLEEVASFFQNHRDIDGITGRCVDEQGADSSGHWDRDGGLINRFNVWRRGVSTTMFLRKSVIKKLGGFDESLGLAAGTPWEAGEDTDYLLRALKEGFRLYYNPHLSVYHPQALRSWSNALVRAEKYGQGIGWLLRKHRYPLWFVVYLNAKTVIGILVDLITGNKEHARFRWAFLKGKARGWLTI